MSRLALRTQIGMMRRQPAVAERLLRPGGAQPPSAMRFSEKVYSSPSALLREAPPGLSAKLGNPCKLMSYASTWLSAETARPQDWRCENIPIG